MELVSGIAGSSLVLVPGEYRGVRLFGLPCRERIALYIVAYAYARGRGHMFSRLSNIMMHVRARTGIQIIRVLVQLYVPDSSWAQQSRSRERSD